MEKLNFTIKALRSAVVMAILILSFGTASAHRIEVFSSNGCTSGQNLVLDAVEVYGTSVDHYNWEYRDNSGVWKCFSGTNVINGFTFTASGFSGTASSTNMNNPPTLTIYNATTALDNVLVRVLIRENYSPCNAPAGTVYGGDDLNKNETKNYRLHVYSSVGDCGGNTPGCIGNLLTSSNGYYGGFEARTYSATNDAYTDYNFISGAGSSAFTVGSGAGQYRVLNNPYAVNSSFAFNIAPHTGNFQMVVTGNTTSSAKVWYKSVNVVAGQTYNFCAWATRVDGTDANVVLRVNGVDLANTSLSTTAVGNWINVCGNYTATTTGAVEISIGDKNASSGANNYSLDDICFRLIGSIGNMVFNDMNKNGIRDNGEVGVAGVSVSLMDANGKVIASTLTDGMGNYRFTNLNTSATGVTYTVDFSLPAGYQFTSQGTLTTDDNSDANQTTGTTGPIVLTSSTPSVNYVDAGIYLTSGSMIGDRVWNDLNRNGIQDAGEPGIAGVTVMLYTSTGVFVAADVTESNGIYNFRDVAPGSYYLKVGSVPGYVLSPKNNGGTGATDSDFDQTTYQSNTFTVTTGTVNLDYDAGMNQCTVRSTLGDRVFNDLNGDGLQSAGEPGIAGITVQLYNKSTGILVRTVTTDAFGYYSFTGLAKASYYIKFVLPAGYVFTTPNVGADDAVDSDVDGTNGTGTTITIALDDNDVRLIYDAGLKCSTAGQTSIGDFVFYDLNKDGIQNTNEPGAPGITVQLYSTSDVLLQTTATDRSGFYKFTGLTVGTGYIVGFGNLPAGYSFTAADQGANDNIDSDVNPYTGRTGVIIATSAPITNVDAGIICQPDIYNNKGSIGDYVFYDLNADGIQNNNEPGLPGITVTLYAGNGTTVVATTMTDALGKYIFTNVSEGTYVVGFSTPSGYSFTTQNAGSDRTKDSDANPATGKTSPFNLAAGQINTTIDAGIKCSCTGTSSIGNMVWNDLNGNGLYETTEPGVAGVSVNLYDDNGNQVASTTTNSLGMYVFTNLKAGTYSLHFGNVPAGFIATTRNVGGTGTSVDNDSDPSPITFMTSEFYLPSGVADYKWDFGIHSTSAGSIGDKVFNDLDRDGLQDSNEPGVSGILVTLYSNGIAISSTVTDADGNYIFQNIPAGNYSVGFSNLPANTNFTTQNAAGTTTDNNSDANQTTGLTSVFTLNAGQCKTDIDAGLVSLFASVGNFVFVDANSNGLQDANEKGYGGITITVYNAVTNQPITSSISDGNGFYMINNIPVSMAGSSFYLVLTGLLPNSTVTVKYAAGTNLNSPNNSDFGSVNGVIRTDNFVLMPNEYNPNIDAGIILPPPTVVAISGIELAASLNNNITTLKWYTDIETHNDHFSIERSIDGSTFTEVGVKAAVGSTTGRTNYSSLDDVGAVSKNPVIYYRIKSIATNGEFVYSNIVSVRPSKSGSVEVWPNPFVQQLNIKVNATQRSTATMIITDAKGMTVRTETIALVSGTNKITYTNVESLARGTYTVRIINNNETIVSQIVVKN